MLAVEVGESHSNPPTFEFDPDKSARAKADPDRLIDFVEAQRIWEDLDRLEVPLPFTGEVRRAVIGRIGLKLWTAVVTDRGKNIRIISVRRAHKKEEQIYGDQAEHHHQP